MYTLPKIILMMGLYHQCLYHEHHSDLHQMLMSCIIELQYKPISTKYKWSVKLVTREVKERCTKFHLFIPFVLFLTGPLTYMWAIELITPDMVEPLKQLQVASDQLGCSCYNFPLSYSLPMIPPILFFFSHDLSSFLMKPPISYFLSSHDDIITPLWHHSYITYSIFPMTLSWHH